MFDLSVQTPITIEDFLADYPTNAWVGFIQKSDDRTYHYPLPLEDVLDQDFSSDADVYMTYNTLKRGKNRKKANVKKLAMLFVDLDVGRDDATMWSLLPKTAYKQAVISSLEASAFGKTIPEPNYICDSGRGLYLLYKIYQNEEKTKQEHKNAAKRWERVNSFLTSQLEMYEADRAVATDEARVLRIPGSINSHSKSEVKFYEYSKNTYTLHRIEHDYMNKPTEKQLEAVHKMEMALGIKCKVLNNRRIRRFMEEHETEYKKYVNKSPVTDKQLNYAQDMARMLDITCPKFRTYGGANKFIRKHEKEFKKLKAEKRASSTFLSTDERLTNRMLETRLMRLEKVLVDAKPDTYRETGLFFYRLFALELTQDKTVALEMMLDLNDKMHHPLSPKSIKRTTKTAESYYDANSIHKLCDKTLAKWFDMTEEEWKNLIPVDKKKEDKGLRQARNRRYYENKLIKEGKTTKEDKIKERRELMYRLICDGKKGKDICNELHISKSTYYAELKAIQELFFPQNEKAHDVEMTSPEKLDAYSNSVPIGTLPCAAPVSSSVSTSSVFFFSPGASSPPGG